MPPSPTPGRPSSLPQQIPPQVARLGTVADEEGKQIGTVTIDVNWWLFLYNIAQHVLTAAGTPIPISPVETIALVDGLDVVPTDALQAHREIINAMALEAQDIELLNGIIAGLPLRINNAQLLQPDPDVTPTLRDLINAIVLASDILLPDAIGSFTELTVSGPVSLIGSPLIKTATRAVTAVSGVKLSNSQSTSSTLAADIDLTLTFNETGTYALDGYLSFYETTLGTGGFQFDFNSGSATLGAINFGVDGYVTAAVGNAAVTSISTATSFGTVVTSSSAPSWLRITGYLTITGVGTFALRWAQASTLALDPTNLLAGSRLMATKIG